MIDNVHEMVYNHAHMKRLNLLVTDEQYEFINKQPNKSGLVRDLIQAKMDAKNYSDLQKQIIDLLKEVNSIKVRLKKLEILER